MRSLKIKKNSFTICRIYAILLILCLLNLTSPKCGHHEAQKNTKVHKINHHSDMRVLQSATWTPIRIYLDYTTLDNQSADVNVMQIVNLKVLMNKVVSLFASLVNVKQAMTNLVIQQCDPKITIGTIPREGAAADLVIFPYFDLSFPANVEAAAAYCSQDANSNRPLAGYIAFNKLLDFNKKNAFYYNTLLALHEINHILSFSAPLFTQFIDAVGQPLNNVVIDRTVNGIARQMIASPKVVASARKHYNCTTIEGLELEDQGGAGTAGSHWEARLMAGDFMIGESYGENVISEMTLALMEDSGWYTVNYYTAGLFRYGKNAGCDFLNTKCVTDGITKFNNEFSTGQNQPFCFAGRTSKGVSSLTSGLTLDANYNYFTDLTLGGNKNADYCPITVDRSSADTYFPDSCWMGTSTLPASMAETIGPYSNCFISSLTPQNDTTVASYKGLLSAVCYETTCDSATLTYSVRLGSSTVNCPTAGGTVTLLNYDGTLFCPSYYLICTRVSQCGDTADCVTNMVQAMVTTNTNYALNQDYLTGLAQSQFITIINNPVEPPPTTPTEPTYVPPADLYTEANCFYDSVQNLYNRLYDRIQTYLYNLSVAQDTNINKLYNAAVAFAQLEVYRKSTTPVDGLIVNAAQEALNNGGTWTFVAKGQDYLSAMIVDPTSGDNLNVQFWTALNNDWNQVYASKSSYPINLKADFWKLVTYTRTFEYVKFTYNDKTKCLPTNFDFIKYSISEVPNISALEEFDPTTALLFQDRDEFNLDTFNLQMTQGMAVTFWTYQNIQDLSVNNSNKVNFMEAFAGGMRLYDISMSLSGTSNLINNILLGDYSVDNPTKSNCVEYAFVQLYFSYEVTAYRVRVVIRYLSSNTKFYLEKSASYSLVENLTIKLNRPQKVTDVRVYKNLKYTPQKEVALFNLGTDTSQFDALRFASANCAKIGADCLYQFQDGCYTCQTDKYNLNYSCVFSCPEGFFEDKANCSPCYTDCAKCFGVLSNQCSACKTNYNLFGTTCMEACPSHTFATNQVCLQCTPNCGICNDATTCNTCINSFFLHLGTCLAQCYPGWYKSISPNVCLACDVNCSECTDVNKCQICKDGFYVLNGMCLDSCPDTYYKDDSTKSCQLCLPNCSKCTTSSKCEFCSTGFFLQVSGTACLDSCPLGTAALNGACLTCTVQDCGVCNPVNLGQCTACMNNTFLKNNSCVAGCGDGWYLEIASRTCIQCPFANCNICSSTRCFNCIPGNYVLEQTQCVANCPDGYIQSDLSCLKCAFPTQCKKCSITNISACTECYTGNLLLLGRCLANCPLGYFPSGLICDSCIMGCNNCNNKTTCTDCSSSYFKKGNICVVDCGTGFVALSGTNICAPCTVSNCDKCDPTDPTKCLSCQNKMYLYSNSCYTTCPIGTFPTTSFTCENCLTNCAQCINKISCNRCVGTFQLQNNVCANGCLDTFVNIGGRCTKCLNTTCKNCDTTLRTCTTCETDRFMYKGNCFAVCPDGSYPNNADRTCYDCVRPCKTCTNDRTCTTCIDRFFLFGTTCTDLCPAGTVRIVVRCVNCTDVNCVKCDATGVDKCLTCKPGWFLLNGGCVATPPSGFYIVNGALFPCLRGCRTCNTASICQKCNDGLNLLDGKSCVVGCPDIYVQSSSNNECLRCKVSCKNCLSNDLNRCTACSNATNLYLGNCLARCPDTTYVSNGECLPCGIEKCASCERGVTCTRCLQGFLLYENTCVPSPCPDGYTQVGQVCNKCPVNRCRRCPLISTCSECTLGNFLSADFRACESSCPMTFFRNTVNGRCDKCGTFCGSCSDPRTCLICMPGYALLNNACVLNCPDGHVRNNGVCVKCTVEQCRTCPIGNVNECQLCIPPLFLHQNQCVRFCPEYTFNKNNICTGCPTSCVQCLNERVCTKCEPNRLLLPDNTCGTDLCPDGTIPFMGRCVQCSTADFNCKRCSSTLLTQCTECKTGFSLVNNSCVSSCPDRFYDESRICKKCLNNCLKCLNPTSCIICEPNFVLQGTNMCLSSCFTSFVPVNGVCTACSTGCSSCTSPSTCTKCAFNYFLEAAACVLKCSAGRYPNALRECLFCSSNCSQCSSATSCQVCFPGHYLKSGYCVDKCGPGFTIQGNNCVACGFGCDTCNPLDVRVCTKCLTNYSLLVGTCSIGCPLGYYSDANSNCQKCIAFCDQCSDSTTCNTCKGGYFLHPNKTLCSTTKFCADGFFSESGSCVSCLVAGCKDCISSKSTCASCFPGLFNVDNASCVPTCPEGRFPNTKTGTCDRCPALCRSCTDNVTCTSCVDKSYLWNGLCTITCPEGTMNVNGSCVQCKVSKCKICDTDTLSVCSECLSGNNLLKIFNENGSIKSTSCESSCPAGRFSRNQNCESCPVNCSTCSNATSCQLCMPGYLVQNEKCQTSCDNYFVNVNGVCTKCNFPNCLVCDNIGLNLCTKCDGTTFLKNSQCFTSCGDSFFNFYSVNTGNVCYDCVPNCKTCTNATTCQTCSDTYFYNGSMCSKCIANCKTCANSTTCDVCSDGYFRENNQCVTACSTGFALVNKNCMPCSDPNCASCDAATLTICSACKTGFTWSGSKCQ